MTIEDISKKCAFKSPPKRPVELDRERTSSSIPSSSDSGPSTFHAGPSSARAGHSSSYDKPSPSYNRPTSARQPINVDSGDEYEDPGMEWSNVEESVTEEQGDCLNGDWEAKEGIRAALTKLDAEIKSVQAQLQPLQTLLFKLTSDRRLLETSLINPSTSTSSKPTKPPPRSTTLTINYQTSTFPFSSPLLKTLSSTFHLSSFRLCQQGVINAAMDGRDIICVMPTGGGKSLTYQLPGVMGIGTTVVVSPLLALIWDQVRGLRELGVEAVMLTGGTSKEEQNEIFRRMESGTGKEIKLCYLTPEKISKSKRLMSVLEKVNAAGRLKRFVIDEAHCCSQLGHDFRPDYKKLSVLKTLFPNVPIQAVTATLSSKTLPDLLKILQMKPICDGNAANKTGTVFFSAPLFRPNLHYQVLSKPSSSKAAIERIGTWITANHPGKSGIIYCLSKKDAETLADSLKEWSDGAIKTGVYHAGVEDWRKEQIHVNWRKGKINVICATIAFGLGIDKGDVRYVIHHSMSKSLEGYYQETGRAGRDGEDSDCVLFYRGQDASRLSSLVIEDQEGGSKLREMLRFAQDLVTCRKVAFAKYFSTSSHLSTAAWDNPNPLSASTSSSIAPTQKGTLSTCGICDNCTRDPSSIILKDVTVEAWKIIKVGEEVKRQGGRVTVANLGDLCGVWEEGGLVWEGGKGKGKRGGGDERGEVDLGDVGGKIRLGKDDTEALLIHLTLEGYLEDSYHATSYAVNVYTQPSPSSYRFSRYSLESIEAGDSPVKIEYTFLNSIKAGRRTKGKKVVVDVDDGDEDEADGNEDGGERERDENEDDDDEESARSKKAKKTKSSQKIVAEKEKGKGKGKGKAGAEEGRGSKEKKRDVKAEPRGREEEDDDDMDKGGYDSDWGEDRWKGESRPVGTMSEGEEGIESLDEEGWEVFPPKDDKRKERRKGKSLNGGGANTRRKGNEEVIVMDDSD